MGTTLTLTPRSGRGDGYSVDLPLDHELDEPLVLDASRLVDCHPMLAVRIRLFIDWHLAAGHDMELLPPSAPAAREQFVAMGIEVNLPDAVLKGPTAPLVSSATALLPVRRLREPDDVEEVSCDATDVLVEQASALARWGDPVYMAVSELCSNALQHGADALGAYVAADRIGADTRQFRLAIADLGIGIPEHIRSQHPEWHDDTAAITRALDRGVSGTGDPHRGNGFAEVFDDALDRLLVQERSAVTIDIRSGKGRVVIDLLDGRREVNAGTVKRARRGTWITYTVTSV